MNIPLFKTNIPNNINDGILSIINSGFIGQGKYVDEFEVKFGEHFGLNPKWCVSTNSCTSSILLALELIPIQQDEECLTTPYTCIATNIHIEKRGFKLKWYDVDPITGLCSLELLKKFITDKTKVVIVANIAGTLTSNLVEIYEYCHKLGIYVIEDCAQSLGAMLNNKYVVDRHDFLCFSFQAIKHLTTIDGGMLYVNSDDIAKRAKNLRWFGFDRTVSADFRCEQNISEYGFKIHMTDMNAYLGIESLKSIDSIIDSHKTNGCFYIESLPLKIVAHNTTLSSFWTFPIHVEDRSKFILFMKSNGIQTSLVQNRLDTMECFKSSYCQLPNLDNFMRTIVHIPCGWWLSDEDKKFIVNKINLYMDKNYVNIR